VKWKTVAVVIALIVLAFAIGNEWVRRHRTLHVVNGYAKPVVVDVPGAGRVQVNPGRVVTLALSEGDYHASVSGAVTEEVDFSLRDSYWHRWGGKPVWVLNPGGAAILERRVAIYQPAGSIKDKPLLPDYHFGERFQAFGDVDHPFSELPQTVSMKSSQRSRTLTGLSLMDEPVDELYHFYLANKRPKDAQRLAEARLRARPDDDAMLNAYVENAASENDLPRLEAFLKDRCRSGRSSCNGIAVTRASFANPEREKRLEGRI
jgi:hypothetical protein